MKSDCRLATILAHTGIKSDEATGALAAPIYFSTTYQHPEFGKRALITRELKIRPVQPLKRPLQQLKKLIML